MKKSETNAKKICNRKLFDAVLQTETCDKKEHYRLLLQELELRLKDWLAKPIFIK